MIHFRDRQTEEYMRQLARDRERYTPDGRLKRGKAEPIFIGAGVTIVYRRFR